MDQFYDAMNPLAEHTCMPWHHPRPIHTNWRRALIGSFLAGKKVLLRHAYTFCSDCVYQVRGVKKEIMIPDGTVLPLTVRERISQLFRS